MMADSEFAFALQALRTAVEKRSFGVIDDERRLCVAHGYKLALEDVERAFIALAEDGRVVLASAPAPRDNGRGRDHNLIAQV